MQTRKGKKKKEIRKSTLKPALWSFVHLINKSHIASVPLRSSAPTGLLWEPQANPKILQGHICAEDWVRTLHSADERHLGCSQLCAEGFSPIPIFHNKMTVKVYFPLPHEVWNSKSSKELLWQLPGYLWEPVLHLFKPCWSHAPPQQGPDFLQNISTLPSQPS